MTINKTISSNIDDLNSIDEILQIQLMREHDEEMRKKAKIIAKCATFKKGDIIRSRVGNNTKEEALLILHPTDYCNDCNEDANYSYSVTYYRVADKNGKTWPLRHAEGTHPECNNDYVRLLKAKQK